MYSEMQERLSPVDSSTSEYILPQFELLIDIDIVPVGILPVRRVRNFAVVLGHPLQDAWMCTHPR